MGKRVRLKDGDIFSFALDDGRLGIGQVIEAKPYLYITILRDPTSDPVDLNSIRTHEILLCGRTMDALFFHDRWHVVGNLPVPPVPRPWTKVQSSGQRWISDFHGRTLIRRATDDEWARLDFHSSVSPITYQRAFNAWHGLADMEPYYAPLFIEHVKAQAELCTA